MWKFLRQGVLIMGLSAAVGYMPEAVAQTKPATKAKPTAKKTQPSVKQASDSAPKPAPEPALWPVDSPDPLPGEIPPDDMLAKLDREVAAWNAADSTMPVQPALHLIALVANDQPGPSGKYRTRMDSALIEKVYGWAKQRNALLFLDLQVGQGTLQEEIPRLTKFLKRPDVHLGIDPEFSMKKGHVPGTRIGTFDADDINYASAFLQKLVSDSGLPPKVLVVHRFTRDMLTGYKRIKLDPRVQIVVNMDGWGPPSLKRDSYRAYVYKYPVEYTGFKLFYKNDTKKGDKLMSPASVLALNPRPVYIQYQ
jgi:hypothetical protein